MLHRLLWLVPGLAIASPVWAFENWPTWRGKNRDGISSEKGLLDRWDEAPPLLWKAKGIGIGYSGVVVARGHVCTMGDRNGKTAVVLLSDKDGKELWGTEIDDAWKDAVSGPRCTPTMDGERIYAVSPKGILACLTTTTGEVVWKRDYKKDFNGRPSQRGYCESPLIDGDKLICSPGGAEAGVVALDKNTGKELWRCALSLHEGRKQELEISYSSPVISYGAGVKQYIKYYGGGLGGLDAETGKQLWNYGKAQPVNTGDDTITTPIIRGNYVFVSCAYGGGAALVKLVRTADGGVDAQEVYYYPPTKLQVHHGQCVLIGDYLYLGHGQSQTFPKCLEFLTGKFMWDNVRGPGHGSSTVAYADGHLYFLYQNGVMSLVAANPEKYQEKGKIQIRRTFNSCWAYPAISNGRLYVRNHTEIYCYDVKKKSARAGP